MVGQARDRTSDKTGWAEPRTTAWSQCSVNHPGHHTGAHATRMNHDGAHATREAHATRNQQGTRGGAYAVDGWDNTWRSRAPGPHAHRNAARQVVDGPRTEVCGQQKQSNDPHNTQHNPNTPTTGRC